MANKVEKALAKNDWPLVEQDGLTLVLSPLLRKENYFVHAFTTRLGGHSQAPLDSFNLGRHFNTEESRTDAMRNRDLLCKSLSLDSSRLAVPGQEHTNNVHTLEADESHARGPFHYPGIDAIATARVEQPVLLHFADCVPVMLVDRVKRQICVIHAGWRGTAGSIVKKSVQVMVEKLDSKPGDIAAAVGPAIGSCCYETGDEVVEKLNQTVEGGQFLTQLRNGRHYPDIKAYNAMQLLECGVENIDVASWCTACNPEIFYSHRQSGGQTGRQGALACILKTV